MRQWSLRKVTSGSPNHQDRDALKAKDRGGQSWLCMYASMQPLLACVRFATAACKPLLCCLVLPARKPERVGEMKVLLHMILCRHEHVAGATAD